MGNSKLMNKTKGIMDMADASTNKILGLSRIGSKDERPLVEKFKVPWYFDTWFSKGFLLFLLFMTVYAVIRIIFRGWW